MKIAKQTAVTIHYKLSNAQGEQIESSFGAEPMLYLHGAENIIPGLESALEGKEVGDKLEVEVEAEQGYGEYHDGLKQEVPLSAFGDIEDIVPGMRFIAETEMGQRPVQVTQVNDETVTVDGNHPLAGQSLHFSVEIMTVREATDEEMAHGHIHAEGGSCGHDHDEACNDEKPGCDGNGGCGCH
ncbi:peptidylprolyl isomerase [Shewanella intestini]|uniref:Peptidyl-prolyl cis-trans isomerase n=1 Tax=Shewanella intestini TaxID=2017544 RepID=A0ABS5HY87_9GAMM|nr:MULTISPECIES: peptidylprolyl isomerase [Shewanella]MBR9726672.1 peptidylprolyl isomerase [Shewanella intestini]MRG34762.1 peptidylprolyl isomerase [Shewanella sp. XMDDZSB0408]